MNRTATPTREPSATVAGLAEQLARIAHFRALDLPEVIELDSVALFLLGDAGSVVDKALLWERLQEDCTRLWHLVTSDWDDRDVDELTDADWERNSFATQQQEIEHRYEITRNRLCHEIENTVWLARVRASELRRERVA